MLFVSCQYYIISSIESHTNWIVKAISHPIINKTSLSLKISFFPTICPFSQDFLFFRHSKFPWLSVSFQLLLFLPNIRDSPSPPSLFSIIFSSFSFIISFSPDRSILIPDFSITLPDQDHHAETVIFIPYLFYHNKCAENACNSIHTYSFTPILTNHDQLPQVSPFPTLSSSSIATTRTQTKVVSVLVVVKVQATATPPPVETRARVPDQEEYPLFLSFFLL